MFAAARQRQGRLSWLHPDGDLTRRRRFPGNRRRLVWSPSRTAALFSALVPLLVGTSLIRSVSGAGSHPDAARVRPVHAKHPKKASTTRGGRATYEPGAEGRWVEVWATAYCPDCAVCDTGSRTATGRSAATAGVAVAARGKRAARLGSWVYVRNFGWLRVDDTGGGVHSNQIDIRMQSHHAAVLWGRRLVRVCLEPSG